jgi:subtilase family protein
MRLARRVFAVNQECGRVPPAKLVAFPALAFLLVAAPPYSGVVGSESVVEAAFLSFLRTDFVRHQEIDQGYPVISTRIHHVVGDIPIYQVGATINAGGKEIFGFYNEDTIEYLGDFMPSYLKASHSKVWFDLREAMLENAGTPLSLFVTVTEPPGFLHGDDVAIEFAVPSTTYPDWVNDVIAQQRSGAVLSAADEERYFSWAEGYLLDNNQAVLAPYLYRLASQIRQFPGVSSVQVPVPALAGTLRVRAMPETVPAIAALQEVDGIDHDRIVRGAATIDQARISSGTKAANDAGYEGSSQKLAVFDKGINAVNIGGQNRLPLAGAQSWAPNEASTADLGNHGTGVSWIARGNPPNSYIGVSRAVSLYNAKVMNQNGDWSQSAQDSALSYAHGTWGVTQGSWSIIDSTAPADDGYHWSSRELDYFIYTYTKSHSVSPGNTYNIIYPPGGAYNVMTVGAYDDHDDGANGPFTLANFTPIVKTADNRKKPDTAWPGVDIQTYDSTGSLVEWDGNSLATPHAAGGSAVYGSQYTTTGSRNQKCALISGTAETHWQEGWGWGKVSTDKARKRDGAVTSSVNFNQYYTSSDFSLPNGKYLHAVVVWWREMNSISSVKRVSDLDLTLTEVLPFTGKIAGDISTLDNVEAFKYFNGAGYDMVVNLQVFGYSTGGYGPQDFTLCWDVR